MLSSICPVWADYVRRGGKGVAGGPLAARMVSMANIHIHSCIPFINRLNNSY